MPNLLLESHTVSEREELEAMLLLAGVIWSHSRRCTQSRLEGTPQQAFEMCLISAHSLSRVKREKINKASSRDIDT